MYFVVPMLWERAIFQKVDEISASQQIPANSFGPIPEVDLQMNNWAGAHNQSYQINTQEFEHIAVHAQADQAIRQAQQAQDQASRATHPNIH
jgi:hypothetical protein